MYYVPLTVFPKSQHNLKPHVMGSWLRIENVGNAHKHHREHTCGIYINIYVCLYSKQQHVVEENRRKLYRKIQHYGYALFGAHPNSRSMRTHGVYSFILAYI